MIDELIASDLLLSIPILLGSSVTIAFVVSYLLFHDDRQVLYKSIVASVITTRFASWPPLIFVLMYTAQRSLLSVGAAIVRTLWFSIFVFPQVLVILILIIIIAIRHARGPEKSYKVEALVALFVAIAGSAWTTFCVVALSVLN